MSEGGRYDPKNETTCPAGFTRIPLSSKLQVRSSAVGRPAMTVPAFSNARTTRESPRFKRFLKLMF